MLIDMHMHEKTYSPDSHMSLSEIVAEAKRKGLDAVCITDHDNQDIMDYAHSYSKEINFPIFVGAEILTKQGDIVVFGLDELPGEMLNAWELLELVKKAGGIAFSAHPYRKNNRGLEDLIKSIPGLGAVEGFNGSTPRKLNIKACSGAEKRGIPIVASSDAHLPERVGLFSTKFFGTVRDEQDIIEAIKTHQVKPMQYYQGEYIDAFIDVEEKQRAFVPGRLVGEPL